MAARGVHAALLEGGPGGWRRARPNLALAKHCLAGLAWSVVVLGTEEAWGGGEGARCSSSSCSFPSYSSPS